MVERKQIEKLVREKLSFALKKQDPPTRPLDFVNEKTVLMRGELASILIASDAIITPAARDTADQIGVCFKTVSGLALPGLDNVTPHTVVIGSDHGGFSMKESLKKEIEGWGYSVLDVGTHSLDSVDYPDFAHAVASVVGKGHCTRGIVIDGAGIGSAMVANKVCGVRAANCHNLFEVKNSREHNNANVLSLGAGVIGIGLANEMVKTWLKTPFAGGRHQRRVDKISEVEKQELTCHT